MFKKLWDNTFSDEDYVYGVKENVFINQMSKLIPEQSKVGCFAEGEGRNAVYLAKLGHDVTAYDLSDVGLKKAKALATENAVEIETIAMDLTKEKAGNGQYDAAVMVFGHLPKSKQPLILENMIDSVKEGGHVIFEVYSDDQLSYKTGGPQTIEALYNPADILKWIGKYQCIHFYYGEVERNEGKRHVGLSHVIQVVIKKVSKDI